MKRLIFIVSIVILFALPVPSSNSEQTEVRILYMNDFHGFADPYKPYGSDEMLGGISYLAARAEKLRKEKPSLFLSGGDMIQGDNWANLFQGESVIELMNVMKFDAMVVGNHEFDFGPDVLKKRISQAGFAVLGANVGGIEGLKPYVIKDLNGIKAAIIGIVTEDTPVTTHPRNVEGIRFMQAEDTVRRYINELKDKSDILIVLSHRGFAADKALSVHVEGIDVIVGGHSHTRVEKPVIVGKTIILQAWEHAKALGVLDITLEDGRIIKADGHLEAIRPELGSEDMAVRQLVVRYRQKIDMVLNEKIGHAVIDLDGENVRRGETNLGDLVADIMRSDSGADIAVINGGSIRRGIKKGDIRVKDAYSALPFDNYIVAIRLTGGQIRDALEHGVSALEEGAGMFPQVSGVEFEFDSSAPSGSRVKKVLIAGRPLITDSDYVVATNDFLAAGGDGFKVFGEAIKSSRDFAVIGGMMKAEKLVYVNTGKWLRDVVVDYIRGMKEIAPVVDGRIRDVRLR